MKLVESKAELIQQEKGLDGLYKHIETCGRVPYKSESNSDGTVEGAKLFTDRMIKSKHLSVLEQGTVYLKMYDTNLLFFEFFDRELPWIKWRHVESTNANEEDWYAITTNLRYLIETGGFDTLIKYMCEPTPYHEKRYTFKVNTSIGITREFNRHRLLSILEQSTRYCNYSKDKFENQISFCKPVWLNLNLGQYEFVLDKEEISIAGDGFIQNYSVTPEFVFLRNCLTAENNYLECTNYCDLSPQQARETLPLCTATEAVYTGFASDWGHFFNLRFFESTGKVHPNMLELSTKMRVEALNKGIWEDICKTL